ncbi:unnamed protein product [Pedinophyceae sp. YPF-701]|nr:unnamed protein product [Pedinophyceae sp. YPF-701]
MTPAAMASRQPRAAIGVRQSPAARPGARAAPTRAQLLPAAPAPLPRGLRSHVARGHAAPGRRGVAARAKKERGVSTGSKEGMEPWLIVDGEPIGQQTWYNRLWWDFGIWFQNHWLLQYTEGLDELKSSDGKNLYLIAANHQSHLDTPTLYLALRSKGIRKFYALGARDYFFKNPFKRWFVTRWMNVIPISRKGFSQRDIDNLLALKEISTPESPSAVIMFPEGTRSTSGELGRFKTGVGYLAAKLNVPVVPTYAHGTIEALSKTRIVPIRAPMRVRFGDMMAPPKDEEEILRAMQAGKGLGGGAVVGASAVTDAAGASGDWASDADSDTESDAATSARRAASKEFKAGLKEFAAKLRERVAELGEAVRAEEEALSGGPEVWRADVARHMPLLQIMGREGWAAWVAQRIVLNRRTNGTTLPAVSMPFVVVFTSVSFALRLTGDFFRLIGGSAKKDLPPNAP